jgi:F-type H+-transporting ATPase subunit delta
MCDRRGSPFSRNGTRVANEAQFSGIAGRYALAVFELAQEENVVDAVGKDFAALKEMISTSPDLTRFVHAPVFDRETQKKGMTAVLVAMDAATLTKRFVQLLASKRRLFVLVDAIKAFEGLVAKQNGEVDAVVTAARLLSETEISAIKGAIKSKIGRDPRLYAHVDPSILGGLVVKVGSRMIDMSLRAKLSAIRIAMRG